MDIPDLGVAHEPVAETDGVSVSKKGAIGVFVCEGIHVRGIRSVDGIALHALLWGDPPAIVDAAEVSSEQATLERRRTSDTLCSSPEPWSTRIRSQRRPDKVPGSPGRGDLRQNCTVTATAEPW